MERITQLSSRCPLLASRSACTQLAAFDGDLRQEQARAIDKDAYSYANPMVVSYQILHNSFADRKKLRIQGALEQDQEHFPCLHTR